MSFFWDGVAPRGEPVKGTQCPKISRISRRSNPRRWGWRPTILLDGMDPYKDGGFGPHHMYS